jgi:hypothetical protein
MKPSKLKRVRYYIPLLPIIWVRKWDEEMPPGALDWQWTYGLIAIAIGATGCYQVFRSLLR